MRKSQKHFNSFSFIAKQWDCNARYRFQELFSGQDQTYKNILCPLLYKLLSDVSPGRTVLDVGCGLGFFSDYIHNLGFDVVGIDIASDCISIARENFPSLKFHATNILDYSKEEHDRYDACVANMFFHNVPNIEEIAESIYDLLKPKGVLIGCIPHPVFWFNHRRQQAKRILVNGRTAYLAPFKIRGSSVHPAPFTYFDRNCDDYWRAFTNIGFSEVHAVSFEKRSDVPNDLVFFVAQKK